MLLFKFSLNHLKRKKLQNKLYVLVCTINILSVYSLVKM